MEAPDLALYHPHRTIEDIDLEGVVVPGLRGEFLRRPVGDRVATVGLYSYAGRELFRAWGYVGEEHCRYHAVLDADGTWEQPQPGCPRVRIIDEATTGVAGLAVRSVTGTWIVSTAQREALTTV